MDTTQDGGREMDTSEELKMDTSEELSENASLKGGDVDAARDGGPADAPGARGDADPPAALPAGGARGLKLLRRKDARRLADDIRRDIGRVRRNLLKLYEGRGWEALGYESWRQCVGREFRQAQSHMYRLLDAARIERNISPEHDVGGVRESVLRPLGRLEAGRQAEAWGMAVGESGGGEPTARVIKAAVRRLLGEDEPDERHSERTAAMIRKWDPDRIRDLIGDLERHLREGGDGAG